MKRQQYTHWKWEQDDSRIVWLSLDTAENSTNVLSTAVFEELERVLDRLEDSPPKGVVFLSGKTNGFIAGADINEFKSVSDREDAKRIIVRGQAVMDRIEALLCPSVALINGFCMGGGVELALACTYRIGLDDPKTRLSLPEVKIGIHPGFGGTMRSLRVLGPLAAMDLMLTGRSIDARRAKKIGLLDYVIPLRHERKAARYLIDSQPPQRRPGIAARLLNWKLVRPLVANRMRGQVAAKAKREHYPAPYALIDLWERYSDNERVMLKQEAESVADLSTTATARNLVRVFFLQDKLKAQADTPTIEVGHVHVLGGGLMGGDIAAWCALQGFKVTIQDMNTKSLGATLGRASKLFSRRFKSERLITAARDRLIADEKGYGLPRADVVIEAIYEDVEIKQSLYRKIEPKLRPDALLASNTSSIPIETLAEALNEPRRLVGIHFFNPVARLPLVEIVCGKDTEDAVISNALGFTRSIDKLPLKVKSSPGFLVNRILTPYLLEAVLMESEGIPKALIDKAAVDFGMPMGPLQLADTVGLDVGLHVGELLGRAYGFEVPDKLKTMVRDGNLGVKSGRGFYEYRNGKPVRDKREISEGDTYELQNRLILRLVNEAVACLRERVVESADMVDAGVIFGTGFPPFHGGPLHYRECEGRLAMRERLKDLRQRYGDRFAVDSGW